MLSEAETSLGERSCTPGRILRGFCALKRGLRSE